MAAVDLLAGTVMDLSASLLNDTAKTTYTYAAQIPYVKMALQELRELFELNSIPATQNVSAIIPVDAGETSIVYNGTTTPALPSDFVEPIQLWERPRGIDPFVPMTRKSFLPEYFNGIVTNNFVYFAWVNQEIKLPQCNADNDVRIDYVKQLFNDIVDQTSIINVVNAATFLQFRTAGLCAEFIERNTTSASSFNQMAILALDRAVGIGVKSKQTIMTRRRPFRGGYKRGGWV